MATYVKRGTKHQAKVRLHGVTDSKTFDNKTDARKWATAREAEIVAGKNGALPDKTFGQLLAKYAERFDAAKHRADIIRVNRLARDDTLASVPLRALDSTHVADWRDRRAKQVSASSVRREWNTLSAACRVAIIDWKWLHENPFREVSRPPPNPDRFRRITDEEIAKIIQVSGYTANGKLDTQISRLAAAFLFAIETGMRIGEICGLYIEDVFTHHVKNTGVRPGSHKNKASIREVPLSTEAERIVKQLVDNAEKSNPSLFRISSAQTADTVWREKICAKALIEDLHFHDSRHEAISRLAPKLDILTLAAMVGVKDLRTLQIYYNPKSSDVAARL